MAGGMLKTSRGGGTFVVPAFRLGHSDEGEELCAVIVEEAVTLVVEAVGTYTLMWTPTLSGGGAVAYTAEDGILGEGEVSEPLILAAGFLFTEGIITGLADIRAIAFCPDNPRVVNVHLFNPARAKVRRASAVVNSSCGVCGEGGHIDELCELLPRPSSDLMITTRNIHRLMAEMRGRQAVFEATGGAHAAAVFTAAGEIAATAEDLGRHNALDKVIGRCLFGGIDTAACGVLLSSRLSLEMIVKAIRAGFQVVAAVSAPTSLAIELATRKGVTLCGFVREGRCTVYSSRHRIGESEPKTPLAN